MKFYNEISTIIHAIKNNCFQILCMAVSIIATALKLNSFILTQYAYHLYHYTKRCQFNDFQCKIDAKNKECTWCAIKSEVTSALFIDILAAILGICKFEICFSKYFSSKGKFIRNAIRWMLTQIAIT